MPYDNDYNKNIADQYKNTNEKFISHMNQIGTDVMQGGSFVDVMSTLAPFAPLLLGLAHTKYPCNKCGSGDNSMGYVSRTQDSGMHDSGYDNASEYKGTARKKKGGAEYEGKGASAGRKGGAYLQSSGRGNSGGNLDLNDGIYGSGKKKVGRPKVGKGEKSNVVNNLSTLLGLGDDISASGKKKKVGRPLKGAGLETSIDADKNLTLSRPVGGNVDRNSLNSTQMANGKSAAKKPPSAWLSLIKSTLAKNKNLKGVKDAIAYIKENNLY